MKKTIQIIILTSLSATAMCVLPGCKICREMQGYPETGYKVKTQIKNLTAYVEEKHKNLDSLNTIELRDDYISHRIDLADLEYYQLLAKVTGVKNGLDSGKEIAVGTMGAVGALVGGGTAQILSAATAATTAANASIDKVYFYNQTMPAIVSAMNAGRNTVLATITENKLKPTYAEYKTHDADIDLNKYYFAGTFAGASETIQKNSSEQSNKADETIKNAPAVASGYESLKKDRTGKSLNDIEKNALKQRNPTLEFK